ncbi:hypothetical protein ACS0TY_003828 [Phlomoides rotata]
MCNKLASRHVRVGLAEPSQVLRCDICENAHAFFYCDVDGTSLCLQCDMIVHVGGKRTHGRYLLLRQRVEFPVEKLRNSSADDESGSQRNNLIVNENSHQRTNNNNESNGRMENMFIDLNASPRRVDAQERRPTSIDTNHESESLVPDGYLKREPEK